VLALWRLGRGLARSCALSAVSVWRATGRPRKAPSVRPPWREWGDAAQATQGTHRHALAVAPGVVPRRSWGRRRWQGTQRALAREATLLGPRFAVLAGSVVSRGGAMPGAWPSLLATPQHAWRRHWRRLRRQLRPAIPPPWPVSVRADRGLDAGWVFRRSVRLGWHPVLRLNTGGSWRPAPQATSRPLPRPGTRWRGPGPAVTSRPRRQRRTTRLRLVSIVRRGWSMLLMAWLAQPPLPRGGVGPEPWPALARLDRQALAPELSRAPVAV
jgi:hypothetical protein